jgi:hypothetical protein
MSGLLSMLGNIARDKGAALLAASALASASASTLVACGSADGANTSKPGPTDPPWEHPVVGANGTAEDAPSDLGPTSMPPPKRGVRRLRIDTLQAAMTRVAGTDVNGAPITWKYSGKDGFSDGAFGKALGRPDFQTSTEESTVTNSLYLKFVGDAARDICMQMAKNDMKRPDPAARALFPKAAVDGTATEADVTENLRYLVLRFVGLRVPAEDPMIAGLREVYAAGAASVAAPNGGEISPAAEGWRGVCVALFESPLFHID